MRICNRYTVSGVVQGVGFRYHAQRQASLTGLAGWVRNLDNGDVEVVACGKASQLEHFYDWLREGPRMARVDRVEVATVSDSTPCDGFIIR